MTAIRMGSFGPAFHTTIIRFFLVYFNLLFAQKHFIHVLKALQCPAM